MLELLAKASDAGLMFWQSLDERERLAVLTFTVYLAVAAGAALLAGERRRREDHLVSRFRAELATIPEVSRGNPDSE